MVDVGDAGAGGGGGTSTATCCLCEHPAIIASSRAVAEIPVTRANQESFFRARRAVDMRSLTSAAFQMIGKPAQLLGGNSQRLAGVLAYLRNHPVIQISNDFADLVLHPAAEIAELLVDPAPKTFETPAGVLRHGVSLPWNPLQYFEPRRGGSIPRQSKVLDQ